MIDIREEQPRDIERIREVNTSVFGQPQEADLVDQLRRNCRNLMSLVAVVENQLVGHLLFSPVTLESGDSRFEGMGLAPMAVLPEYQRQGIGSALIRAGITKLRRTGCPFVIVLGHADYYPRFGFEPASRYGVRSEWEVADESFMILVLDKSRIAEISGLVRYRQEFHAAM